MACSVLTDFITFVVVFVSLGADGRKQSSDHCFKSQIHNNGSAIWTI